MSKDFTKEFFIRSWPGGYYENFSYGVGIDKVKQVCIDPFSINNNILEIGSGGGSFTFRLHSLAKKLTCIDVIPKPATFWSDINYIELKDKDYYCTGVPDESIEFAFSYNVFCHLSNDAIRQYLTSVNRVLAPGGDFVFMLSAYGRGLPVPGELLPMGHFSQDERTLDLVIGEGWEIVSRNMIPEHRDIIVHLNKSYV